MFTLATNGEVVAIRFLAFVIGSMTGWLATMAEIMTSVMPFHRYRSWHRFNRIVTWPVPLQESAHEVVGEVSEPIRAAWASHPTRCGSSPGRLGANSAFPGQL